MRILWVIVLGVVAGTVDVLPMVLRGMNWREAAVPFVHWVVTTVLIASVAWPLHPALRGALVAFLTSLPTLIRYSNSQPGSVVPVFIMSLVIGSAVGMIISLPFFPQQS